jgi:hypothetical protein
LTVDLGGTVGVEKLIVEAGAVAFVDFKRVGGELPGQAAHKAVAAHFGYDGGAGDEDVFAVSAYDSLLIFVFLRSF